MQYWAWANVAKFRMASFIKVVAVDKTGNSRSECRWKLRYRGNICVNEAQKLSEYQVNLAEGRKEKSQFLTAYSSVGRWPFWKYDYVLW